MKRLILILTAWLAIAGPVDAALVLKLACQDNAASTTVVASTGSNGTLVGGDNTSAKSDTGPGGSYPLSLHLNGSDDYITITDLAATLGDNASFCCWVKLDVATPAAEAQTGFAVLGNAGSGGGNHLPYTDGSYYISLLRWSNSTTSNRLTITPPGGVTRTNWHHVTIVTTPGANGWKLFVNGDQVTQQTGITGVHYPVGGIWSVGRSHSAGVNLFLDGSVADVRVYTNTLSEGDVETIVAEATGGGGSPARKRQVIIVGSLERSAWKQDAYGRFLVWGIH
jgi:hypothetical protein